jgi:hypothetical protein
VSSRRGAMQEQRLRLVFQIQVRYMDLIANQLMKSASISSFSRRQVMSSRHASHVPVLPPHCGRNP